MATICFVTYEIHPTNRGGCGVLLHHAAEILLRQGHRIVFLLAAPRHEADQFNARDKLGFSNHENCVAYHVGTLCEDMAIGPSDSPCHAAYEVLRFAHAFDKVARLERPDFTEFFEYCGSGAAAFARRLFGREGSDLGGVLGARLHGSIEVIDQVAPSRFVDRNRYYLHALERAGLRLSEAVLTPSHEYFSCYYQDRYGIEPSRAVVSESPKPAFPRVASRPPARGPGTIALIGRMYAFKGVDQFVHAGVELLRRRPDAPVTFDIIGPDATESPFGATYGEFLRTFIPVGLRERFAWAGHQTHEQIVERLSRALFAVFPNRIESFCYAAHEVYDAGVPLIVNAIPAFREYFTHERNALVYDGSTDALVASMERMLDDPDLRERLCKPYPIATNPLGDFYEKPRALKPLRDEGGRVPGVLVIVLGRDDGATLEALSRQAHRPARVIRLWPSRPDHEETFWFLGQSWHVRDEAGGALAPSGVRTLDAVVILRAGDRPAPDWLHACVTALRNRADLGFAGTWGRREGRIVARALDWAPEAYPFEYGCAGTRAVIRTQPGRTLIDLLDPALGALGELGLAWDAVARVGHGALLHEALVEHGPEPTDPPNPSLLKYLVARYGGVFSARLRDYAALLHDQGAALSAQMRLLAARAGEAAPAVNGLHAEPTLEHKISLADELGGGLLARMAWKKLKRRVMDRARQRR